MIKKILDNFNYVKELKKEIGNMQSIINKNREEMIEFNKEKRNLENINVGLKAQIRELKKDIEILKFKIQSNKKNKV